MSVRTSAKFLMCAACVALVAAAADAATIIADFDSRSETDADGPGPTAGNTSDLGVGPISAGRSFRTYLTFDLAGEQPALDVALNLFNTGNENNTSALPQTFSVFTTTAWDGTPAPGPDGVEVATLDITPMVGGDNQDLSFNSPALTAAYNAVQAVGGLLHLGIRSSEENADARSFVFLGSREDVGIRPVLQTVEIPEPASAALTALGLAWLALRRRD